MSKEDTTDCNSIYRLFCKVKITQKIRKDLTGQILLHSGRSLYSLDFHLLDLGLFKLKLGCLRFLSHDSSSPMFSDLIKSLIVVCFNSFTEVGKGILVLWPHSCETKCCGRLLVNHLTQSRDSNNKLDENSPSIKAHPS